METQLKLVASAAAFAAALANDMIVCMWSGSNNKDRSGPKRSPALDRRQRLESVQSSRLSYERTSCPDDGFASVHMAETQANALLLHPRAQVGNASSACSCSLDPHW